MTVVLCQLLLIECFGATRPAQQFSFPEIWTSDDDDGSEFGNEGEFFLHYWSPRGGGALANLIPGIVKDAGRFYFNSVVAMDLLATQDANGSRDTVWRVRADGPFAAGDELVDESYSWSMEQRGGSQDFGVAPSRSSSAAGASEHEDSGSKQCPLIYGVNLGVKLPGSSVEGTSLRCPFSGVSLPAPMFSQKRARFPSSSSVHSSPSSPSSHEPSDYALTREECGDLFPYFFKFNEDFVVQSAGKQLMKKDPTFVGSRVDQSVTMVHPSLAKWNWPDLLRVQNNTFEICHTSMNGLGLVGGLYISRCPKTAMLSGTFMGAPDVSSVDELVKFGLGLDTDIPRHSAQRRLVLMNEHLKSESYLNVISEAKAESRKKSLDLKRLFVRYVSHEVRTPLSTVSVGLGLIQSLRDTVPRSDRGEELDRALKQIFDIVDDAKESVDIAVETLNDLLLYEKIEGGLLQLELSRQPVVSTIFGFARQFSVQCKATRIKLECTFDSASFDERELVSPTVFSKFDKAKIAQVVRNLLSNAFKFSSEGSAIKLHVSVVTKPLDPNSYARVEVKDTGVGMERAEIDQLFDSIVQFNPEKLQCGGGSGIGLYVSKGIMDLHGGSIGAISKGAGSGTTFHVDIPLGADVISGSKGTDEATHDAPFVPLKSSASSSSIMSITSPIKPAFTHFRAAKRESSDMLCLGLSSSCSFDEPYFTGETDVSTMIDHDHAAEARIDTAGASEDRRLFRGGVLDSRPISTSFRDSASFGLSSELLDYGHAVDIEALVEASVDSHDCSAAAAVESSLVTKQLRILLVDDSTLLRKMTARFLSMSMICESPQHAANGAEAVKAVHESIGASTFDAILVSVLTTRACAVDSCFDGLVDVGSHLFIVMSLLLRADGFCDAHHGWSRCDQGYPCTRVQGLHHWNFGPSSRRR